MWLRGGGGGSTNGGGGGNTADSGGNAYDIAAAGANGARLLAWPTDHRSHDLLHNRRLDPNNNVAGLYAPFLVSSNLTVKAMADASGYSNSTVASQSIRPNIASGTLVWSDEFARPGLLNWLPSSTKLDVRHGIPLLRQQRTGDLLRGGFRNGAMHGVEYLYR